MGKVEQQQCALGGESWLLMLLAGFEFSLRRMISENESVLMPGLVVGF